MLQFLTMLLSPFCPFCITLIALFLCSCFLHSHLCHHLFPLFCHSPILSSLWIHLYQPISVSPQQIHNIRQHSGSGPPPLLLAPRASVPSVQIQGQRIIQQGLIRVANVPNASLLVNIPQVSCRITCSGPHRTAVPKCQARA